MQLAVRAAAIAYPPRHSCALWLFCLFPATVRGVLTVNSQKYDSSQSQTESLTTSVPVLDKLAQLMICMNYLDRAIGRTRFVCKTSVNAVESRTAAVSYQMSGRQLCAEVC